jgi:hypothetical protein
VWSIGSIGTSITAPKTPAAATPGAAFTLGEAEAIRSLLTDPGFRDVHIRLVIQPIRYGSLEEFLPGYLAAIPMAGAVATLDEASRAALFRNVTAALHGYVDDGGLAAPMECHVVTAHV